jgi:hypothetical protein
MNIAAFCSRTEGEEQAKAQGRQQSLQYTPSQSHTPRWRPPGECARRVGETTPQRAAARAREPRALRSTLGLACCTSSMRSVTSCPRRTVLALMPPSRWTGRLRACTVRRVSTLRTSSFAGCSARGTCCRRLSRNGGGENGQSSARPRSFCSCAAVRAISPPPHAARPAARAGVTLSLSCCRSRCIVVRVPAAVRVPLLQMLLRALLLPRRAATSAERARRTEGALFPGGPPCTPPHHVRRVHARRPDGCLPA